MLKRNFAIYIIWLWSTVAFGQAPGPQLQQQPGLSETSITVQQIVARQEAHYRTFKTSKGTVVWQEKQFSPKSHSSAATSTRVIYFASGGDRSVTLVLPQSEARTYAASQGRPNWSQVLSAALVTANSVQTISLPTSGTQPEVHESPYNPAVHDNNPLVAFHPRQVGDERIPLRELVAASSRMPTKPRVYEFRKAGRLLLRVDFSNTNAPDEALYYIIDPNKGYLPVEIGRLSQGKYVSRSTIVIGSTPDKSWIPARRETIKYNGAGTATAQETWYYEYFALNENLEPQVLSLLYFNLPPGTKIFPLPQFAKRESGVAATPASASSPPPARMSPAPAAATTTPGARRYY